MWRCCYDPRYAAKNLAGRQMCQWNSTGFGGDLSFLGQTFEAVSNSRHWLDRAWIDNWLLAKPRVEVLRTEWVQKLYTYCNGGETSRRRNTLHQNNQVLRAGSETAQQAEDYFIAYFGGKGSKQACSGKYNGAISAGRNSSWKGRGYGYDQYRASASTYSRGHHPYSGR
ncbi:unnamed protein product [Amoebophrya sp. A120]|nr:unnamed protein product [Amoebophrya sp. A120]|eukprot:GSA120T00008639001.1